MTLNRKKKPSFAAKLLLAFFGIIYKANRFHPNIFINDGDNLSKYGLDAVVLHLPGHSKGSIGILTATGNLFCGDLLLNIDNPSPTDLLDDLVDLENSIERLQNLTFHTIYPGHGKPFSQAQFLELIYKRK
jgi:glyoxylase-like metal-dependent hydrolase (beta-lactamase superfamily II)